MLQAVRERYPVLEKIRKPGKNLFWAWIAYQTVKGTLTTAFIWLPMVYMWTHH